MIHPATIMFNPALPWWLILVLLAAAGVITWFSVERAGLDFKRKASLVALALIILGVLTWLVLMPERRRVNVDKEPPVLAIAVDVSASMTEKPPGATGKTTRAERALDFLAEHRLKVLQDKFQVWVFELGDGLEEGSFSRLPELQFNAAHSNLTGSLNTIAARLQGQNAAGIILLSDGLDNSGEAISPALRQIPVYNLELEEPMAGAAGEKPDYWVADLSYPNRAVVNWQTRIQLLVRRRGTGVATIPVKLYHQGDKELRNTQLAFTADESFQQASFEITPTETGTGLYRVAIEPEEKIDSDKENNSREFVIEILDPQNRVLYLEGAPRWEFKFLKRALITEKNLRLSAFVSAGTGGFVAFRENAGMVMEQVPPFTREGLAPFKVIILGNLPGDALKEADYQGVHDFVDKGGGLLLLGGTEVFSDKGWPGIPKMRELLPVTPEPGAKLNEGRFTVELSPEGKLHPALQGLSLETGFPPLLSMYSPVKPGEFASSLLTTTEGEPLLSVRRFGQGKVAILLSDSFWRWQLGGSDTPTEKNLYNQFFSQLVIWLAPSLTEKESSGIFQIFTAANEVDLRKRVVIGASLQRDGKPVEIALNCDITPPGGTKIKLPMASGLLNENVGLTKPDQGYLCEFTPTVSGRHEIEVTSKDGLHTAKTVLLVRQALREKTGAPANREYLESLAKSSGGRYVLWKDRRKVTDDIPCKPRERQTVLEYPLWPNPLWLFLLIGLFCFEWWWRRKLGLS